MKRPLLVMPCLVLATGCIEGVLIDPDEREITAPPTVELNPGEGVIPFPNNLLIDPETGTVDLPPQCGESPTSEQLRENVLNELDGFGTFMPVLRATFTEAVDISTLEDRVWLFQVQAHGSPNDPAAAEPVPIVTQATQIVRFSDDCATSSTVPALLIIPTVPLEDDSTYTVALLEGIETTGGEPFSPSVTWILTRPEENPVDIVEVAPDGSRVEVARNRTPFDPETAAGTEAIVGINRLWMFNAQFLPFLAAAIGEETNGSAAQPVPRDEILLAWAFNTQTEEAPLDPSIAGSLAAGLDTVTPNTTTAADFQQGVPAPQVMSAVLCAAQGAGPGCGVCDTLPCDAVGAVKVGTFAAPSYLTRQNGVLGPWTDPLTPELQEEASLEYLAFFPAGTPPAGGWPVVIFGHGLGRSKQDLFALASQLAAAGAASIAFDWVLHGSRAVQISNSGECAGDPDPTERPQCFQPPLSPDLAFVRDSIRQSVLDTHKLVAVLQACGGGADCGAGFDVAAGRIGYLGTALGGILGSITAGMNDEIDAAVLNTTGADWVRIITETDTDVIRCGFIDGLIRAGVLEGNLSSAADPLCLTDEWRDDPAFLEFVTIARWVLDPAEPANFADELTAEGPPVLLQEVSGDEVVPNSATEVLGNLLGLTRDTAAVNTGTATPSPAVATPGQSAWLVYGSSAAGGTNEFSHGSLLRPVETTAGALGTAQMQTDAITFLIANLAD